jgi:hypothetical protein
MIKVGKWIESYQGQEGYFLVVRIRGDRVDLVNVDGNAVSALPDEPKNWFTDLDSLSVKSVSEVDFLPYSTFKRIIKAIFKATR